MLTFLYQQTAISFTMSRATQLVNLKTALHSWTRAGDLMRRRIRFLAATLCIAVMLCVGPGHAFASGWPLATQNTYVFGPEANATGNQWCGYFFTTSYGNVFVGQTQSWVNYGGTCNGQWGRPAGYLQNYTAAYVGNTEVRSSGWVSNGNNFSYVQTTVPQVSNANAYATAGLWYNGTSWQFSNYARYCSGTCG